jgi:hypothetical protein
MNPQLIPAAGLPLMRIFSRQWQQAVRWKILACTTQNCPPNCLTHVVRLQRKNQTVPPGSGSEGRPGSSRSNAGNPAKPDRIVARRDRPADASTMRGTGLVVPRSRRLAGITPANDRRDRDPEARIAKFQICVCVTTKIVIAEVPRPSNDGGRAPSI